MPSKETIKVGGVPEHFNLPWHLAIESNAFENDHFTVEWRNYPGGTGAMTEALNNGELDIAISLTEGIVANIIKGGRFCILQNYVTSPLTWGVYVSADAPYQSPAELKDKTFAISRMGSGSHLMAFVYAQQQQWPLNEKQLTIANDLQGMVKALNNQEADILLWEKYTTQPYVSSGHLRLLDDTTPQWPAFVMAVSNAFLANEPEAVRYIQKGINRVNQHFMKQQDAVRELSGRYDMSLKDAESWFSQTHWATDNRMDEGNLRSVVATLYKLGLIGEKWTPGKLCSELTALKQHA